MGRLSLLRRPIPLLHRPTWAFTWEQMNTCSCLTLIRACIVYWQAREISRALSGCDPAANRINLSLLEHVSLIDWDNVVLYGHTS
jgi:hypothetical protein